MVAGAAPYERLAQHAPQLHLVLATVQGVVALVVAYLLYGRYRRTGRATALLVTYALVLLAVANLLPQSVAGVDLAPWGALVVRLLGVGLLVAAALTPASVRAGAAVAGAGAVLCAAALLAAGLVFAAYASSLPSTQDLVEGGSLPGLALVRGAQSLSGLLYAVASVAFTRQAGRESDDLLGWIGAGCALAAVARVNYLLFPSVYSDDLYTGDVLRLGFYLFMLVGAMREVRSYWESLSYLAVLEDRRRLARDLHDGLTQELTYIWSQSRLLAGRPGDLEVVERISGASARALDEARTAIAALTRTTTGSFASVLRASTEALARRYEADAVVHADGEVRPAPEQADAILRIVAEAFRNAVWHGRASCVWIDVTCPPLSLVVRDDGRGFDAGAPSRSGAGFGLTSMLERATGSGATFALHSEVGRGTVVEAKWL